MIVFVDTNILVYGTTVDSPFYQNAIDKLTQFDGQGILLCISNQVLREYMTVTTRLDIKQGKYNPSVLEKEVMEFEENFQVVEENRDTRKQLLALLHHTIIGGKQVHDANLVATMLHYGIGTILTHNIADFKRFDTLIQIMPLLDNAVEQ